MMAMALLACGESEARAAPVDEQEQRRMEWARQQAVWRVLSVEEMREYLRCCGDDEARATENLPQLDKWTQEIGGWQAISLLSAATRPAEQRRRNEVIYQECKDGKLTYEVTAPPAQIRALGMPPVMLVRPLDCPDAPRPPAKPRSKSGQRRAHARWGR
jgi:hypothetical protein